MTRLEEALREATQGLMACGGFVAGFYGVDHPAAVAAKKRAEKCRKVLPEEASEDADWEGA
jgi:hypothetical protein